MQADLEAKSRQTLQMWRNLYEEIEKVDVPTEEYVPPKQKLPELTSLLDLQDPEAAEIRERQIRKRAMRAAVQVVASRNEGGKMFEELSEDTVRRPLRCKDSRIQGNFSNTRVTFICFC